VLPVRVVAWNIQQGAPSRGLRVVEALMSKSPDVVVLTEYHLKGSRFIAQQLAQSGLTHQVSAAAGYGYAVLLASRWPLVRRSTPQGPAHRVGGYVEAELLDADLVIAGVYVPVISAVPLAEKRRFLGMLHDAATRHLDRAYMSIGDWNTGDFPLDKEAAVRPFSCTPEYRHMATLGLTEAWRSINGERQEYSWRSNRKTGFRIDHAFVTPPLRSRLVDARYSHQEREARISDHSMLIVDLGAAG
jgi:exodeoxyribonuclease III